MTLVISNAESGSSVRTKLNSGLRNTLIATDVKTGAYTATAGDLVLTDSSGGAFTVTLPATPSDGDVVGVLDVTDSWGTENVTVARNSTNIEGAASDLTLDGGRYAELRYAGATPGWVLNFVSNGVQAPAASDTVSGTVELATTAEVRSATAAKALTANHIEDASAIVTLTDAATIAVDWDTFVNGEVTITANRTLGLPTNGQPGTWRSVAVVQDGTGTHTLAFASGYEFVDKTAPVVTAAANARSRLSIFCRTTSAFEVYSGLNVGAPA